MTDDDIGDHFFPDIFRFMIEPAVDFLTGMSLTYLFYHLGKASEEDMQRERDKLIKRANLIAKFDLQAKIKFIEKDEK